MDENGSSLYMSKKLVTEASSLMGTLDQAWNIGRHEREVIKAHHPKIWGESRERVVGDLGPGGRQAGQQGGFSGIGQTNDSDIREES